MKNCPSQLIWTSPSPDASGSMALGNGDLSANVWLDPAGDVFLYLGKSDSWGEFGQLYKVGLLRIRLADAFAQGGGGDLLWKLNFATATIEIATPGGSLRLWMDAHAPCLHIAAESATGLPVSISILPWRNKKRLLEGKECHGLHQNAPYPVWHDADIIPALDGAQIAWLHHNATSSWRGGLEQQGLEEFASAHQDPLLGRTFGGLVRGRGFAKVSEQELVLRQNQTPCHATVTLLTLPASSPELWLREVQSLADALPGADDVPARSRHEAWWREFWSRSALEADGNEAARKVTCGYQMQRYLNACAGRGAQPIKFNGSLFTVPWNFEEEEFDADYRRWGPGYWHQNTRLPYWAMLAAGDFDLMRPYFHMYREALPLARERCRKFCGHDGAFFPETMTFWGAYLEHNYGWPGDRDPSLPGHLANNRYIRHHHSSGLEVVYHALLFHQYTGDEDFLRQTALPLAEAVLDYYDNQFPRKNGHLVIEPAQVIEQWWIARNPLPEIAGLHACLDALLALPLPLLPRHKIEAWQRLRIELPPIPTRNIEEHTVFAPAEFWDGPPRNTENPELYAVFPYHRCGLDSPDIEVGRETFRRRTYTHDQGWAQDGMQAALLGLADDARYSITRRLTTPSAYARFPGFWGPGFDWIPDQDQGGSASHAFQLMALQSGPQHTHLFPAWPKSWTGEFRLHARDGVVVEARYEPGKTAQATASKQANLIFHR